MKPKERMLAAMAHQEPDRVPVGEWEYGSEIIEPILGSQALFHCGMKTTRAYWAGRRDEIVDQWKKGLVELADRLQWDAILVHLVIDKNTPIEAPEQTAEDTWRDSRGNILTLSRETDRLMITQRGATPALDPQTPSGAPQYMEPTESELEVVRYVVRELGKTHFLFAGALQGHPRLSYADASVSEVENWVSLYKDPDAYRDSFLQGVRLEKTKRALEITKREGLDAVAYGCDFGYNAGPFISPELFRHAVLPGLSEYCALAHRCGLPVLLHSCGNNQVLMDTIIEAGVDVYQSIQPEMDIVKMKQRYGKNITLWGGVSSGDLVLATPAQVRQSAAHFLKACKPGGGYVFGTSHSIMPGAKFENYMAMLEAHREWGAY